METLKKAKASKITLLTLLIIFSILTLSCQEDKVDNNDKVLLKFKVDNSLNRIEEGDVIEIEAIILSTNPWELESEYLEKIVVNAENDDRLTYAFVLNSPDENNNSYRAGGSVKRGYFFNSGTGCFHYGTIYTGDNGNQIFVADTDPVLLFAHQNFPICPDYDEAFARDTK